MRIKTIIILFILVCVIIFCLIKYPYINNDKKEHFNPSASPSPSPSASPSPSQEPIDLRSLNSLDSTLNNLNSFANGLVSTGSISTPQQLEELQTTMLTEIKTLSSTLNSINDQLKLQQQQSTVTVPPNTEGSMNLMTTQMLQNNEIEKLTERLKKLKMLYQSYLEDKVVEEQPKIPIYSSCIVSEASGGYSLDNINNDKSKMLRAEKPVVYANQRVVPGTQTYNPNKDSDINNVSLTLEDIINQLSQNKINVNFNV
jgi:hypothetical protein